MATRKASHAGSWYVSDGRQLRAELDHWLRAVETGPAPRAIIVPHAGYRYSGACAAHAYRQVDPTRVRRVFVLGPSHHVRLSGCAVSACRSLATPLYDLNVDTEVTKELMATGEFETMTLDADEDEHSIEMHLPYLARVMEPVGAAAFTVVTVMVGSLTPEKELKYGRIFAPYLADPSNLFIISSDFCHWGQRFRYTHYDEKCGEIHQSIKELDHQGMALIEKLDHDGFTSYLRKTGNTICGRHPIGVFLGTVAAMRAKSNGFAVALNFVNYDQSNQCKSMRDSSVSYASAVFTMG